MNWFTGDIKAAGDLATSRANPDSDTAPRRVTASNVHRVTTGAAPASRRHQPAAAQLEPHSATDARARVRDSNPGIEPRRNRMSQFIGAIPAVLLASDVLTLVVLGLTLPGGWRVGVLFGVLAIVSRATVRHYRPRLGLMVLDDLPRLIGSTVAALGVSLVAEILFSSSDSADGWLLQRALVFFVASLLLETVTLATARRLRRRGHRGRRTLVVGDGRIAATLVDALGEHPELGLEPLPGSARQNAAAGPARPLPSTELARLPWVIRAQKIDTTILALDQAEVDVNTIIDVHQTGCEILLVPSMFEMHHDGPDVERIRGIPLLRLRSDPTLRLSWWVKRGLDVFVAGLGLAVLSVPLAVIGLLILLDSGRPVMFWQERVGLDGRTFRLCKFRSMRPRSETESQTTWNIADDPRVSRLGRLLRRTSVDEIPQLWNILRGQMSLVGPRPERPTFVEQFSQEHERYWARHRVPVGLTGLAQVNGLRGDTSIRERARYDNYYIANWTLWLDVKIMLLTAREVLGGRGR